MRTEQNAKRRRMGENGSEPPHRPTADTHPQQQQQQQQGLVSRPTSDSSFCESLRTTQTKANANSYRPNAPSTMMSCLSKSMPTRLRTSAPSSRTLLFISGGVLLAGGAAYVYKKYTRGDCDDAPTMPSPQPTYMRMVADEMASAPVRHQIKFQLVEETLAIEHDSTPSTEQPATGPDADDKESEVDSGTETGSDIESESGTENGVNETASHEVRYPRVHDAHHAVDVVEQAAEVVDKAIAEAAGEVENISDLSGLSGLSDSARTSEGKRGDGMLSTPTVESLPTPSAGPISSSSAMEPLPLPSPLELLRLPVGEAPVAMIPSMATLVEPTASSSDDSVADITPKCRCVVITGRKPSNVQHKLLGLLDELAVVVKILNRQADKDACSRYEAMIEGKLYPKVFVEDAATGSNCQAIKRDDLLNLLRFCRFTEQQYDWELVPPAQRARHVFQDAMARLSAGAK